MMANPMAGEVEVTLDGQPHLAKLTLGALARLEARLEAGSMLALVERFETGQFGAADVLAVIEAGLGAKGWQGTTADLEAADPCGGPVAAARAAARLVALAFAPPGSAA